MQQAARHGMCRVQSEDRKRSPAKANLPQAMVRLHTVEFPAFGDPGFTTSFTHQKSGSPANQLTDKQVCVEGALMGLIHYQHTVPPQQEVVLHLPQQNAIRHEGQRALTANALVIAHL
jgi:hypothetical protein